MLNFGFAVAVHPADANTAWFDHGLGVDPSGPHLLMGSTTGGLWSSDDGCDRRPSAAPHLPLIYAVRFG